MARISRQGPAGRLSVTVGGDGLPGLTPPFSAFLYEPPAAQRSQKTLLAPSEQGLDPAGQLFAVQVVQAGAQGKGGRIMINPLPDIPSGIEGCWLCVERTRLSAQDELYFFELREFAVQDADSGADLGRVAELMDTAAHGILVVETATGQQVMIPLVDAFTEIDREQKVIRIRSFEEFQT